MYYFLYLQPNLETFYFVFIVSHIDKLNCKNYQELEIDPHCGGIETGLHNRFLFQRMKTFQNPLTDPVQPKYYMEYCQETNH